MDDTNHYEEVKQEAIDALEDRMQQLDNLLASYRAEGINAEALMREMKILTHSVKSASASADMNAIKAIAHRFEDYLLDISAIGDSHLKDMQAFTDRLSETLEKYLAGNIENVSSLMRSLPARGDFDVSDVTVTDTEVMLVMEPGLATKIVTTELLECGYRMVNVASTMDALMLIPSMRPDLVIVSRVMPELDGVDLACAIRAMPATRDIPVALLTSEALDSQTFRNLPKDVPIMRKGGNFGDDVAEVFAKLGLL